MPRLIILIAVVLVAALVYRSIRERRQASSRRRNRLSPMRMTRCSVCGLHIPEHDAIHTRGKTYCSEEHMRQGLS